MRLRAAFQTATASGFSPQFACPEVYPQRFTSKYRIRAGYPNPPPLVKMDLLRFPPPNTFYMKLSDALSRRGPNLELES